MPHCFISFIFYCIPTRSPASMFLVSGMNKQRMGSVIRDTREKKGKKVSNENMTSF